MTLQHLQNLANSGELQEEPPDGEEIRGLIGSALEQLEAEYHGILEIEDQTLEELMAKTREVLARVKALTRA
jgi:hypothetical protein